MYITDPKQIYFWSDPHFSHKNIIDYCDRPFQNVSEMNNKLIDNFRNKVPIENTIVYCLGDIWDPEPLVNLADYKIFLILGNHDKPNKKINALYDAIDKYHLNMQISIYPIIILKFIILSHEPIECLDKKSPFLNIHGHLHNLKYGNGNNWNDGLRYYNVCVEMNNYSPISLQEIIDKIKIEV